MDKVENKKLYFDKIYTRALQMEEPAVDDQGTCMYRSPSGPCLIGVLVTDEQAARADKVGHTVSSAMAQGIFDLDFDAEEMLLECQKAHDEMSFNFDKEKLLRRLLVIKEKYIETVSD